MRILFFSNLHPTPWHPGRGVFNAGLVEGLRAAGHDVTVVVPVDWREQQGSPQAAVPEARFVAWLHPRLGRRDPWDRWVARSSAPDVVLAGWAHPDGAVGIRLARELGVPAAILAGGSDLLLLPRSPRRRRVIARTLASADLVLTHGRHLRDAALALGADATRTVAFYRGVNHDRFSPGSRIEARLQLGLLPEARYLLSVGNMVAVKGLDILVEALARPELAELDWQWVHIGDGNARVPLHRQVEAAGIGGKVRFAGRQPQDRLVTWYRAADLQVLPSRSEGVPNVLLEGLACGLPFVASTVGGVPEIAPDPAWCVPPGDPAALAAAIAGAMRTPPPVAVTVPTREQGVATVVGALQDALSGAR